MVNSDYTVVTDIGEVKLLTIIEELKLKLNSIADNIILESTLYGSYARGNYNEYSDIDIFVLFSNINEDTMRDNLSDISVYFQIKYGIMISIYDMHKDYYNKIKDKSPLLRNIERDGISIW